MAQRDGSGEVVPVEVFSNDLFGSIRVMEKDGDAWFVAKDVCDVLNVGNPGQACRNFDDDEKGIYLTYTPGGPQKMVHVSEAGFYKLVLRSDKPEAKPFQRWVTHEVLPSIRRDGGYVAAKAEESDADIMARALVVAQRTLERRSRELEAAEREVADLRPKAALADAVAPESALMTVTEAVRHIAAVDPEVRRDDVFAWLREDGMLCKVGTAPTRAGIDTGRFVACMSTYERSGGRVESKQYAKVTVKGLSWMIERYAHRRQPCLGL